jgi:hypothetical protein
MHANLTVALRMIGQLSSIHGAAQRLDVAACRLAEGGQGQLGIIPERLDDLRRNIVGGDQLVAL